MRPTTLLEILGMLTESIGWWTKSIAYEGVDGDLYTDKDDAENKLRLFKEHCGSAIDELTTFVENADYYFKKEERDPTVACTNIPPNENK